MTGDYPFLAAVLDADSNYGFASCEIDVAGVSISCGLPPVGRVGQAYDFTFPVSGGLPPYTISITAGTLPPGLSLDATTGEVTGIPTSPGTFAFTVQVEDSLANTASANCFIEIVVPTNSPLVITFRGVKRRRACLPSA
jgi:hypothetical protein